MTKGQWSQNITGEEEEYSNLPSFLKAIAMAWSEAILSISELVKTKSILKYLELIMNAKLSFKGT